MLDNFKHYSSISHIKWNIFSIDHSHFWNKKTDISSICAHLCKASNVKKSIIGMIPIY